MGVSPPPWPPLLEPLCSRPAATSAVVDDDVDPSRSMEDGRRATTSAWVAAALESVSEPSIGAVAAAERLYWRAAPLLPPESCSPASRLHEKWDSASRYGRSVASLHP